jgi:type 1 fimbriae regulatory protein FimB/type 1 fimbriae regulatory protein FimE
MPTRRPYAELRRREHLTEAEVERLMEAAKGNRWGLRDPTMVLVAYRHGLRTATLHVRRVKKGTPSTPSATSCAPCGGCSASRSRSQPSYSPRSGERRSPQRGLPAWSSAQAPKRSWALKPTRTCCGTHAATRSLANRGHDTRALQAYLGHRNIQHTVRYSELAPTRFKDFWRR